MARLPPGVRGPASIDELEADGRYADAAAALQAELETRTITLADRLRLADLLVLADRGKDGATVLLGVADDMCRYGMRERALEALRRADAIQPRNPEVKKRFEAMAREARARRASAQATVRGLDAKTDPLVSGDTRPVKRPAGLGEKRSRPLELDRELHSFVRQLGARPGEGREGLAAALFSDVQQYLLRNAQSGLHRRRFPAGGIVISEGDPGDSIFLLAGGSVRVLVIGGHGRALEIRRLDAPDFFGEVAALSGRPRSATVVAVTACDLLEIDRWALERLVEARPAAKPILEGASVDRSTSAEERAVRSLPQTAVPDQAEAVLAAHFGGTAWSSRVRLHLARQMLDAGLENDALTVIASVAEELQHSGHASTAIAMLKRVDQARRQRARPAKKAATRAVNEASFRTWLGSVAKEAPALAPGAAAAAEQEGAGQKRDG